MRNSSAIFSSEEYAYTFALCMSAPARFLFLPLFSLFLFLLFWTERMRSRRREEFPRGFIKSVKWLLRIGGTQKPGKFFKEDLCHVIQRKNGNQFSVKNWQSMS